MRVEPVSQGDVVVFVGGPATGPRAGTRQAPRDALRAYACAWVDETGYHYVMDDAVDGFVPSRYVYVGRCSLYHWIADPGCRGDVVKVWTLRAWGLVAAREVPLADDYRGWSTGVGATAIWHD